MKRSVALVFIAAAGLMLAGACAPAAPRKVTHPADVVNAVKVGMTVEQALEHLDTDALHEAGAFVTINASRLEVANGTIIHYEPVKDIDAPYYIWLVFGQVVQILNPAVIGFAASPDGADKVVVVSRFTFSEAQKLVEWQSDRPFRR